MPISSPSVRPGFSFTIGTTMTLRMHLKNYSFSHRVSTAGFPATMEASPVTAVVSPAATVEGAWWGVKRLGHRHPQFAADFRLSNG
jgi:hypothetical protein